MKKEKPEPKKKPSFKELKEKMGKRKTVGAVRG